jgi:hypothetical protein
MITVDLYDNLSTRGAIALIGGLAGASGQTISSMFDGYTRVCQRGPVDPNGVNKGGSAWADSPAGWRSAQSWCDRQKPTPAPTPAPPCLPQTDATVKPNCG